MGVRERRTALNQRCRRRRGGSTLLHGPGSGGPRYGREHARVAAPAHRFSGSHRNRRIPTEPESFTYSSFGISKTVLDIVRGTLTLGIYANYDNNDSTQAGILEIRGFPTLFDTLLTYIPTGQSLAILTPA